MYMGISSTLISAGRQVGDTDSLPVRMDNIPFHIYAIKKPDYVMNLMTTYGTNEQFVHHATKRDFINLETKFVSKTFCYPEVIINHAKY